jgi:hypothetical protein
MSPHVVLPLVLLLAGTAASATPAPRSGEAEVRESGNGLPCFTITEREEQRGAPDFQAVTVYDISAKPRVKMWAMAMPPDRTFPVLFSMCVPYGGRVQSLPQTASTPLQPGTVYEVSIDVRPGGAPGLPRSYGARFCVVKGRNGGVVVHHIAPGVPETRQASGCSAAK